MLAESNSKNIALKKDNLVYDKEVYISKSNLLTKQSFINGTTTLKKVILN